MYRLEIEKTASTPYILADEAQNYLKISGESFPENVSEFYRELMNWLSEYLAECDGFTVDFELIYFNSSTSKLLMNLFDMLDAAASSGKSMTINWICDADNDIIVECGEEFIEDFPDLPIHLVVR